MMIVHSVEQGTEEWFAVRCGVPSASRFADIMSKPRTGNGGESSGRRNYRAQLVCERLTRKPQGSLYKSPDMERGNLLEPFARMAYEALTGELVDEVGFITEEISINAGADTALIGCSPDGLVGTDGGVEIKSPGAAKHIETLLAGKIPPEHVAQVQGSMLITGRDWWDFCSYCEELPEKLHFFRQRIFPDSEYQKMLYTELQKFSQEVYEMEERLRSLA